MRGFRLDMPNDLGNTARLMPQMATRRAYTPAADSKATTLLPAIMLAEMPHTALI